MPSFFHILSWKTDLFPLLSSLSIEQYEWNLGHSRIFLGNNHSMNLDRILSPPSQVTFPGDDRTGHLTSVIVFSGGSKEQIVSSLALCSACRIITKVDEDLKHSHASHTESGHKKPRLGIRTTWFGISSLDSYYFYSIWAIIHLY